jgi:PBP1b-binding outer membrane lipoprotein LpoB
MRVLVSVLFSALVIVSCSKKDGPVSKTSPLLLMPVIGELNSKYLLTKEEHYVSSAVSGTAIFQYKDKMVSKRIGGKIPVAGGGSVYITEIYDTVEYTSPTTITMLTKDNIVDFDVNASKRVFTLEDGLIAKKITYDSDNMLRFNDTMYYYYNSQKLLQKTEQFFSSTIITKEYFFDHNSNLQRIKTSKVDRYDGFVYHTAEEVFGGYDNKPNPLKGQTLWPDMFYRTLSTNNFTTYSYSKGIDWEDRSWILVYDSNGVVDFSK